MSKTLAILTTLALFATPSIAQEFRAEPVVVTDANASIGVLGLTVEQAVGMDLYDGDGSVIGVVTRILGDDQDTPTALVVEIGGSAVVFELAATELIDNRIVTELTAAEVSRLPTWEERKG